MSLLQCLIKRRVHSKLNCEVLWDDFAYEVRWAVAGDSIVLQLVARLEDNEYMSFGLSGDYKRSRMVGGDVVVAWVDKESLKGYAQDYYLDAKSQCSGGRGSCPDENIVLGTNSVRLLNAALVNGYSIVTLQRSLKAQDEFDKQVFTNESQPIIWAIGPLNSRKEVSYHSLANRGDIFIDFGRSPKWNCPTPESTDNQSDPKESLGIYSSETKEGSFQEPRKQDSGRLQSRQKVQIPTPAPAAKSGAWEIPPIKCYEPEDGVFYAQMGPTGGKHGYSAITGHVGWGISWYINGLLIPEINVVRGRTYTFIVEGGLDPETPARYHPFYITDDPVGGYQYKTPEERANIQIFAGAVQNKKGEVRPTGVGRLCNWTPDPNQPPADEFLSFGAYQRTLRLECDPGNPGIIQWTVDKDTPDTVYYQCYTHRYLGWKINVHDHCEGEGASEPVPSVVKAPLHFVGSHEMDFEGSESVNYETKIKPDFEFFKNSLQKNQTNFGLNEFVIHNGNVEYYPQVQVHKNEPNNLVQVTQVPSAALIDGDRAVYVNFQTEYESAPPLQSSQFEAAYITGGFKGGNWKEEALINQDASSVVQSSKKNNNSFPMEELLKNDQGPEEKTQEKFKKTNQKLPFPTKLLKPSQNSPYFSLNNRLRKPLPHYALTLQQRPFPFEAFRPPSIKRPLGSTSQKIFHYTQTNKNPRPHHRPNVRYEPKESHRQKIQTVHHFSVQPQVNKKKQEPPFNQDLGQSLLSVGSSVREQLTTHHFGFNPESVKIEGGFKPILSTPISKFNNIVDRHDQNVEDTTEISKLMSQRSSGEKLFLTKQKEAESNLDKRDVKRQEQSEEKEVDLFKNQKPQMFEPIFIPSFPDESFKKHQEKYKKTVTTLKHGNNEIQHHNSHKNEEFYVKFRPTQNLIRRPLYPDNIIPPFKIQYHRGAPQLRHHETDDSGEKNDTIDIIRIKNESLHRNDNRAENILEVIEMYEDESRQNTTASDSLEKKKENVYQPDDDVNIKDEIAMADDSKDYYLPPKVEKFLTYDGKLVKAELPPTILNAGYKSDVSKLPQFAPFKGTIPPLTLTVNTKNLPQFNSRNYARQDILPPTEIKSAKLFAVQTAQHETTLPTTEETIVKDLLGLQEFEKKDVKQTRVRRSPDHIPGHNEHDHHEKFPRNNSSPNINNLLHIILISVTAFCIQNFT